MLLAHITFDTPYVILSVLPKLKQMNRHTYEAALDLGATPMYALFHVIIPECMPGIITGAMLAFTLSLDDFTISYFTTSPLVQNLSTLIYSAPAAASSRRSTHCRRSCSSLCWCCC